MKLAGTRLGAARIVFSLAIATGGASALGPTVALAAGPVGGAHVPSNEDPHGMDRVAAKTGDVAAPDLPGDPHAARARVVHPPHPTGHKTENESTPDTHSNLYIYNQKNGAVQTNPRVYIVFWGDWSAAGDPYNTANRLYYLYNGLGNTGWGQVLAQYQMGCTPGTWNCTGAHAGNPLNPYGGYWFDNAAIPATPTQAQLAAEAARAAAAFGDFTYNAQYVIALPKGHGDTQFAAKGGTACAWHSWTSVKNSWITYTSLPYMTDSSVCYSKSVNGSNGLLDGVTLVASHEYAESVTDPGSNAWYDNDRPLGQENGDKCSGYGANLTLSNNVTYPIQKTWSNYHRYYFGAGCALVW